jgi:hypothetical protein
MSVFEIHGGGDRRSMIKRYERKSKHDAIRELVDLVHCCWSRIDQLEAQVPGAADLADCTGRSPKDYAIEHAEYLAKSVELLSVAYDEYGLALVASEHDEGDAAAMLEAVQQARESLLEALVNVRGYVYEFRKRSARALAAARQITPQIPVAHDYRADLQCWFGLSYASWLTMPRVLMEAMPGDWQSRIAPLLWEYSEAWDTARLAAPYVLARNGNKFEAWPDWLLNYRHPDTAAIETVRAQQGKEQGAGE